MNKLQLILVSALAINSAMASAVQCAPDMQNVTILSSNKGHSLGLTLGYYVYKEPGLMALKGALAGITYTAVIPFSTHFFFKGDVSFAFGRHKYSSQRTGTHNNNPTYYHEMRPLFGKDLIFSQQALSPFSGLGYRFLHHDGYGTRTSTGHYGYHRTNTMIYIPVGFIHRFALNESSKIQTTIEYDHMIYGRQYSGIDVDNSGKGISHNQKKGFGARFSIEYHQSKWSIGPYITYWNIAKSDIQKGYIEPKNNTIEAGFKVAYTF
jgi:hypothetical protein